MTAPVHFKVQLIHVGVKPAGANSDFHRFSGAYTFEEFQATVGLLWGDSAPAAGFVMHYTDEDGDKVLLKDKQDWEECMRVYRDTKLATLRVTVTANPPKEQPAPQQSQPQSQHRERTPPPSCGGWGGAGRSRPNGRRCGMFRDFFQHLPAFTQAGSCEPTAKCCDPRGAQPQGQPPMPEHVDPNAPEEERMWSAWGSRLSQALQNAGDLFIRPMTFMPSPGFEFRTPDQKAVVDLLSSLFGSEAVSNLATGATDAFGSTVRFCRNLGEDLHIDVNMAALYNQSVRAANAAMDAKNYAAAERLLRDALAVFKNNNVLEYNLSCAQSLKGNLHGAFETLQQAIGHGYDNVSHLVSDPDLANLRAFPGFAALLGGRNAERTAPDTAATPKDAGNVTSEAPIPTATAEQVQEPPTVVPTATTAKESPPKDSQFDLCDNDAAPLTQQLPTIPVTAPAATIKTAPSDDVPPPLEESRAVPPQATDNAEAGGLPVPQPIRTILSIFPGMSVADAALALLQAGGNVNVAINNLLASG